MQTFNVLNMLFVPSNRTESNRIDVEYFNHAISIRLINGPGTYANREREREKERTERAHAKLYHFH